MVTRMLRGSAAVGLAVGIWWAIVATTRSVPLEETLPPPLPVASADVDDLVPLEEFAPAFLGMFRKAMLIEDESRTYAEKYDVDIDLVRAVLIQESGGNANLTSIAGAGGYFQVMPATFRSLRVETNIEAGVKYLGQMIRQFRREDYAVAAYNGGPGRARRGRPPLETLQYVLSVGAYRSVLKMHEPSVRAHAEQIELEPIREGDNWWTLSQRTGASIRVVAGARSSKSAEGEYRLRLLLVEERVPLPSSSNGIRVQEMVMRWQIDGGDGLPPKDGKFAVSEELSIDDVREQLVDDLKRFERLQGMNFPEKPLEMKSLFVIAVIQDETTREVLQAKLVPVTMVSASN